MADISVMQEYYLEEGGVSQAEGIFEHGDGSYDDVDFTPLLSVQKKAYSENVYERQMVVKKVLELFRTAPVKKLTEDYTEIMKIVSKLAEEDETMVRTDILEQIPNIAAQSNEYSCRVPVLNSIVSEHLLPLVIKNLSTNDNKVWMAAHSTLFQLMEQGFITKGEAENQVCPAVLELLDVDDAVDFVAGAVSLMCRMAPLLGREITESVLLEQFSNFCTNHMFYVRKVCVSHIAHFCAVIGKKAYEEVLLPCYIELCDDDIWGVRKACAEVIMSVACACPPEARRTVLAPVFAKLLEDQSRWVRISAFEKLGPFISTFADPAITNLTYNNMGELVVITANDAEFRVKTPSLLQLNVLRNELNRVDLNEFSEPATQKDDVDVVMNPLNNMLNKNYITEKLEDDVLFFPNSDQNLYNFSYSSSSSTEMENVSINMTSFFSGDENKDVKCINTENELQQNATDTINQSYFYINKISEEQLETYNTPVENNGGDSKCNQYVDGFTETIKKPLEQQNVDDNYKSSCVGEEDDDCTNWLDYQNNTSTNNYSDLLDDQVTLCDKKLVSAIGEELENLSIANGEMNTNCACNTQPSSKEHINVVNNNCKVNTNKALKEDDLQTFNSYNYWYISPELPLDPSIISDGRSLQDNNRSLSSTYDRVEKSSLPVIVEFDKTISKDPLVSSTSLRRNIIENDMLEEPQEQETIQFIVPQILIDHFISMTDPTLAQDTYNKISWDCAYFLPAVALTLGRKNWHHLQKTLESLAADMQYKVRRTVASSLHELALIVGPEIASKNLTPIFDDFIKDLDEVRIAVLEHLAQFLELISPAKRILYLPKLTAFLQTDNEWDWRFREELAKQLLLAIRLFKPVLAARHFAIFAETILCDKVAAVRQVGLLLLTELIKHISPDHGRTSRLLVLFAERFAHSKKWQKRQTFALLCVELLKSNALSSEHFASEMMPHLLDLSWDPVPNIRLVVARTISKHIITNEYFMDPTNQHCDGIDVVLKRLQNDKDRDVRSCAYVDQSFFSLSQ